MRSTLLRFQEEVSTFGGKVPRTSLTREQEAALQEALSSQKSGASNA